MVYTQKFKESIIQKSLLPGGPSLATLARKHNIPVGTIYSWKSVITRGDLVGSKSKKNKWTPEQKLNIIIETSLMSAPELGEYIRKKGLTTTEIEMWKTDFYKTQQVTGRPRKDPELLEAKKREKELQRDLRHKEKALAEMSARVVLLKKSHLIFGGKEDDE